MSTLREHLLKRADPDYIDRTIETVRCHLEAENCWPQWANIFATEIIHLRRELAEARAACDETSAGDGRTIEQLLVAVCEPDMHEDSEQRRIAWDEIKRRLAVATKALEQIRDLPTHHDLALNAGVRYLHDLAALALAELAGGKNEE